GRYIRKYKCTAMGIVVAPVMDRFAADAFSAAKTDEVENVVLLSSINDLCFYILHIAVNSLYEEPLAYFELPYSSNGERITF
ncbi:43039_t:CDS:1, partial [Gigaspora margarita]